MLRLRERRLFANEAAAVSSLEMDYSKTPQIDPRITWARNLTASVIDFEGLNKTAKANEARFPNTRRVENLLPFSEDFSNASWTKAGGTIVGGVSDPFGGTSAFTATATTNGWQVYKAITCITGHTYTGSYWIRRRTGTGAISIATKTVVPITSQLTSSWKRFSCSELIASGTLAYSDFVVAVNGDAIDICQFQLEDVTGQAITAPADYVSNNVLTFPYHGAGADGVKNFTTTNGNTVASNVVTEAVGTPLAGPITLLAEEARINLLLNSAIPVTQNITTTAQSYTISMWGTGTCTLTGTATGTLTGTGANNRVPLTVTATAGTLTLTFAGSKTNGQAEAGSTMSSYIPTAGTAVARPADVPSFTGAGLSWYNTEQGTFVVKASGTAFRTPSAFGTFNLTLPTSGTYVVVYNNAVKNGSTYLYTLAGGATPVEYTGITNPITTVTLLNGGLANLSAFTYYPKALPISKIIPLLS
jgi:hypothetical protein